MDELVTVDDAVDEAILGAVLRIQALSAEVELLQGRLEAERAKVGLHRKVAGEAQQALSVIRRRCEEAGHPGASGYENLVQNTIEYRCPACLLVWKVKRNEALRPMPGAMSDEDHMAWAEREYVEWKAAADNHDLLG